MLAPEKTFESKSLTTLISAASATSRRDFREPWAEYISFTEAWRVRSWTHRSILDDEAPRHCWGLRIGLFGDLTSSEGVGAPLGGERTEEEAGDAEQVHLGASSASRMPHRVKLRPGLSDFASTCYIYNVRVLPC